MSSDFVRLLGMDLLEVTETEAVKPFVCGSLTELIDDRFHVQCRAHGVELVGDFDGRMTTVFFYSEGLDSYAQFAGELPEGIRFTDTREDVRRLLGTPNASAGGQVIEYLGRVRPWDRSERPDYALHVEYAGHTNAITLVSLIHPDSIPR